MDNLSSPDSLLVTVQKNARSRPVRFGLDKRDLPVGVAQVVWFDPSGRWWPTV